ncbi:L,D-transpeptidase family protein [Janibacter massiliensis]|uniref:L,D-transpeptidase family protein n=1 Tax=Janibacter massiliensis TaxID=2058291 RepID=UPI000D105406|nr:L,D-transpeptidase family protein [Janibacter massiliensis]
MSLSRRVLLRGAGAATVTGALVATGMDPAAAVTRPTLRVGSRNQWVRKLQWRLYSHGYWLDRRYPGYFDTTTAQAVMAFQKMRGLTRDGICGPATWRALDSITRPVARTKSGSIIEVNKRRQVMIAVVNGRVAWVFNTSTGAPSTPTPVGRWRFQRAINGMDRSPLGTLWRPRYFYRGYAIHGSRSIPGYPASHGCARLHNKAIDFIWAHNLAPIGRQIWIY